MSRINSVIAAVLAMGVGAATSGQTLSLIDNPSLGEFIDITQTGQLIPLADEEETTLDVEMFPGNFVLPSGSIVVGINGGLGFGNETETNLEPLNQQIPSPDAFIGGQATLAYWDDIDDKEGDVYLLQIMGDPELSDRVIVQWNFGNFDLTGSVLKFQVQILFNSAMTGIYAQYLYEIQGPSTGAGAGATIGYQDGDGGYGDIQFSFNQPNAVMSGTVLSLMILSPADFDGDGKVTVVDLLLLLGDWGPCADCQVPSTCLADIDGDCAVGISDLLILLNSWG